MKKLTTYLVLIFACCSFSAWAQYDEYDILKGSTLITMKGHTYYYDVDFYGDQYDFIVKVKENSAKNGLAFDYEMTNDNQTNGSVKMSPEALQTAHAQNNYFSGGPMNLEDMTTVWLSRDVLKELEENGTAKISTDGGETWTTLHRKYYNYDYAIKAGDKNIDSIAYMYCESEDGKAKYWVQMGGNPLILKMDLGWTISLREFDKGS